MFAKGKDALCRLTISSLFGIVLLLPLAAGSPSTAQITGRDNLSERVQSSLSEMKKGLDEIEADLTRIEQQAKITGTDDRIHAKMDQVAASASSAAQILIESTTEGDKQQVPQVFPRVFLEFESDAQTFRDRASRILDRYLAIQKDIAEGRIVISLEVFDRMTVRERVEFMNVLSPEAQAIYRKLSPAKFSSLDFYIQKFATRFGSAVKDACVPDANATFAGICVAACTSAPIAGCIACVTVAAGSGALVALDWYYNRKCNCCGCKWYKPGCCACRVACWAAFIVWLG